MIIQMQLLGFRIDEILLSCMREVVAPACIPTQTGGLYVPHGLSIIGVVFRIKVLGIDAGAGERDVFMDKGISVLFTQKI